MTRRRRVKGDRVPFTVSHVAVVWPLRKLSVLTMVPWSAFAIGAMAPDAFYYVGLAHLGALTHNVTGLWLVNIPVTVLLTLLWLGLVRPAVVDLSPPGLRQRWWASIRESERHPGFQRNPLSRRGVALISVGALIGTFSHVLVDAFTHGGRWGAWLFPALEHAWGPLRWYGWLQLGASVVGLVILLLLFSRWYRMTCPEPSPARLQGRWRRVLQIGPVALAPLVPPLIFLLLDGGAGRYYTSGGWNGFASVVLAMGGLGIFVLISAIIWPRLVQAKSGHAG